MTSLIPSAFPRVVESRFNQAESGDSLTDVRMHARVVISIIDIMLVSCAKLYNIFTMH